MMETGMGPLFSKHCTTDTNCIKSNIYIASFAIKEQYVWAIWEFLENML